MAEIKYNGNTVNSVVSQITNIAGKFDPVSNSVKTSAGVMVGRRGFDLINPGISADSISQSVGTCSEALGALVKEIRTKQVAILTYSQDKDEINAFVNSLSRLEYDNLDLSGIDSKISGWTKLSFAAKGLFASAGTFLTGFVEGAANFVETAVDTAAVVATGAASIFTKPYDLITGSNVTDEMWASTKAYVAEEQVASIADQFYANTEAGQWLKQNAYGFDTVRGIGKGVGYSTTMIMAGNVFAGAGGVDAAVKGARLAKALPAMSGVLGFGNGAEEGWANGASTTKGLMYGAASGTWESIQWGVGVKIGSLGSHIDDIATVGAKQVFKDASKRVVLDTVDSGLEGFVQPALTMIYKQYDGDTLAAQYANAFEANGGWNGVLQQAAIGGIMSGASEAGDVFKYNRNAAKIKKSGGGSSGSGSDASKTATVIDEKSDTVLKGKGKKETEARVEVQETSGVVANEVAPVDATPKKVVDEVGKNPVDTTPKKPVEAIPSKPADTTAKKPVEATASRTADTTAKKSVEVTSSEPVTTTKKPVEVTASKPVTTTPSKPVEVTPSRLADPTPSKPVATTSRPVDPTPSKTVATPSRPVDPTLSKTVVTAPSSPVTTTPVRTTDTGAGAKIDTPGTQPASLAAGISSLVGDATGGKISGGDISKAGAGMATMAGLGKLGTSMSAVTAMGSDVDIDVDVKFTGDTGATPSRTSRQLSGDLEKMSAALPGKQAKVDAAEANLAKYKSEAGDAADPKVVKKLEGEVSKATADRDKQLEKMKSKAEQRSATATKEIDEKLASGSKKGLVGTEKGKLVDGEFTKDSAKTVGEIDKKEFSKLLDQEYGKVDRSKVDEFGNPIEPKVEAEGTQGGEKVEVKQETPVTEAKTEVQPVSEDVRTKLGITDSENYDSLATKIDKAVADGKLTKEQGDSLFDTIAEEQHFDAKEQIADLRRENAEYEQARRDNVERKDLLVTQDGAKPESVKGYDEAVRQIDEKIAANNAKIKELEAGMETKTEVKNETPVAEVKKETPVVEPKKETPVTEVKKEIPVTEVKKETPVTEVKQETPVSEVKKETPVTEVKKETPVTEVKKETPVTEVKKETPITEDVRTELGITDNENYDSLATKIDKAVAEGKLTREQGDNLFDSVAEEQHFDAKEQIADLRRENAEYEQARRDNVERKDLLVTQDGAKPDSVKGYDEAVRQIDEKIAANNAKIKELEAGMEVRPDTLGSKLTTDIVEPKAVALGNTGAAVATVGNLGGGMIPKGVDTDVTVKTNGGDVTSTRTSKQLGADLEKFSAGLSDKQTKLDTAKANLDKYKTKMGDAADPKVVKKLEGEVNKAQTEYDKQLAKVKDKAEQRNATAAREIDDKLASGSKKGLVGTEKGRLVDGEFTKDTAMAKGEISKKEFATEPATRDSLTRTEGEVDSNVPDAGKTVVEPVADDIRSELGITDNETYDSLATKVDKAVAEGKLTKEQGDSLFDTIAEEQHFDTKDQIEALRKENAEYEQARRDNVERKELLVTEDGAKHESVKGYDEAVRQIDDKIAANKAKIAELEAGMGTKPEVETRTETSTEVKTEVETRTETPAEVKPEPVKTEVETNSSDLTVRQETLDDGTVVETRLDEDGHMVNQVETRPDGTKRETRIDNSLFGDGDRTDIEYDASGKVVKETVTYALNGNSKVTEFKDNGIKIETEIHGGHVFTTTETRVNPDGTFAKNVTDGSGNLRQKEWSTSDGTIHSENYDYNGYKHTQTVDADGNIKKVNYDASGEKTYEFESTPNGPTVEKYYMDTDAEVREVITNSDGSKTVNTTLKDGTYKVEEINAAGKTIGTERTTLDGTVISNRFNDDGTRTETVINPDNSKVETEYDFAGREIKVTEIRSDGSYSVSKIKDDLFETPVKYDYDIEGKLLRETETNVDGTKKVIEYKNDGTNVESLYDKDGNLISTTNKGVETPTEVKTEVETNSSDLTVRQETLDDGTVVETRFDEDGKVVQTTEKYSDGTSMTREVAADGTVVETDFDAEGKVTYKTEEFTDGTSKTTSISKSGTTINRYDAEGNTLEMTMISADGIVRTLTVNPAGSEFRHTVEPNGATTETVLDKDGVVISKNQKFSDGSSKTYKVDADGTKVEAEFDTDGKLVKEVTTSPATNSRTETTYGKDGKVVNKVTEKIDNNVETTSVIKTNDEVLENGSILRHEELSDGTLKDTIIDKDGKVVRETEKYSDGKSMIREVASDGTVVETDFDAEGKVTYKTEEFTDGTTTTTAYRDSVTTVTKSDAEGNTLETTITSKDGTVRQEIVNPDGTISRYTMEPNGTTTTTILDEDGIVIKKMQEFEDGSSTLYRVEEDGTKVETDFDAEGNIIKEVTTSPETNVRTEITYDKDGNIVNKVTNNIDENVNPVNVVKTSDESLVDGSTLRHEELSDGTLRDTVIDKDGNVLETTEKYSDGKYTTHKVEADGTKVKTDFDAEGKMTYKTEEFADGTSMLTTYDENGTMTNRFDAEGNSVEMTITTNDGTVRQEIVNPDGTLSRYMMEPNGTTTTTILDKDGFVIKKMQEFEDGSSTLYRVEEDGTIKEITLDSNATVIGESVTYTNGLTTKYEIASDGTTINSTVDADGNVLYKKELYSNGTSRTELRESDGSSKVTLYDSKDTVTQSTITRRDGSVSTSHYDADGNVTMKTDVSADGRVKITENVDGTYEKITFDENHETVERTWKTKDGVINSEKINSDGTTSRHTVEPNGVTRDTVFSEDRTTILSQVYKNPDGSYKTYKLEDSGTRIESIYDKSGNLMQSVEKRVDGSRSTTVVSPSGKHETTVTDVNGRLIEKSWSAMGETHRETYNPDGSKNYRIDKEDGSYEITTIAKDGTILTQSWKTVDGADGTKSFSPDGTSYTTIVRPDNSKTETVIRTDGSYKTTEYDSNNNIIGTTEKSTKGTVVSHRFNEDGSQVETIYRRDGTACETKYNTDGDVIGQTDYRADGTISRVSEYNVDGSSKVYEYDTSNKIVKEKIFAADGSNTIIEYDGNGKITLKEISNPDGTSTKFDIIKGGRERTLELDADGNLIRGKIVSPDGSYHTREVSEGITTDVHYNVEGTKYYQKEVFPDKTVREINLDADGKTTIEMVTTPDKVKTTTTYAEDGSFTKLVEDGSHKDYFEYDKDGNVIRKVEMKSDGTLIETSGAELRRMEAEARARAEEEARFRAEEEARIKAREEAKAKVREAEAEARRKRFAELDEADAKRLERLKVLEADDATLKRKISDLKTKKLRELAMQYDSRKLDLELHRQKLIDDVKAKADADVKQAMRSFFRRDSKVADIRYNASREIVKINNDIDAQLSSLNASYQHHVRDIDRQARDAYLRTSQYAREKYAPRVEQARAVIASDAPSVKEVKAAIGATEDEIIRIESGSEYGYSGRSKQELTDTLTKLRAKEREAKIRARDRAAAESRVRSASKDEVSRGAPKYVLGKDRSALSTETIVDRVRDMGVRTEADTAAIDAQVRDLASRFGITEDEMRVELDKKLRSFIEGGEVGRRTGISTLEKCLDSGYTKSQFETGTSGGAIGWGDHKSNGRAQLEQKMFGLDMDTPFVDRPVYGMIFPKEDGALRDYIYNGPGSWYGGTSAERYDITKKCVIIFDKGAIGDRTSITLGDSLDYKKSVYSSTLNDPHFSGAFSGFADNIHSLDDFRRADITKLFSGSVSDGYLECQMHGQSAHAINDTTVKEVIFPVEPSKELQEKLKKANIPWRVL